MPSAQVFFRIILSLLFLILNKGYREEAICDGGRRGEIYFVKMW